LQKRGYQLLKNDSLYKGDLMSIPVGGPSNIPPGRGPEDSHKTPPKELTALAQKVTSHFHGNDILPKDFEHLVELSKKGYVGFDQRDVTVKQQPDYHTHVTKLPKTRSR
jgi:hypothetical protein